MARKSNTKKSVSSITSKADNYFSQIKWGESYTSLFLGAVVVIVALILIFSFIKSNNLRNGQTDSTSTVTNQNQTSLPKTYTVKSGDDLWHISQKLYGSGYNWVDLVKENNLSNPEVLYVDTKLNVPNVKPRVLETNTAVKTANPISGSSYTVSRGDYLWDIAVRAYGDGYKWVDIAKANNLSNPNLIYSGNVFKLPR